MRNYDFPFDADDFIREADWSSEVCYRGSPLTISINPPEELNEDQELAFYRNNLVQALSVVPEIIEIACGERLRELNAGRGSKPEIASDAFRKALKPTHVYLHPDRTSIEFEQCEEIFGDYTVVANLDIGGAILEIELVWAGD